MRVVHIPAMVTFASPPREPNPWFEAPEPLPLSSLTVPSAVTPMVRHRRRVAWPVSALLLVATAMGMVAQMPSELPVPADSFARNRLETQAIRLLQQKLPATPRMADVRRVMNEARVFCQPTVGDGRDSLMTCLGHAVRYQAAYTRMTFRVQTRGDSVTKLVACPALIVHGTQPSAERLERARPTLAAPDCWRDMQNAVDSDWAYASLPDSVRFTVVPLPDAPRMRVESAPSADTITVVW